MEKAKPQKTVLKSDLKDKTYEYNEKVIMYMLTRRPKPLRYRNPYSSSVENNLEIYPPQKTEYGSNFYTVPISYFVKMKGGEWDKYHLGSNCTINIEVPNDKGGKEMKTVYPVLEQAIKDPNTDKIVPVLNYQGLPVLIDVFDNRKESALKDKYMRENAEIKV
jgi:hypothetical protein